MISSSLLPRVTCMSRPLPPNDQLSRHSVNTPSLLSIILFSLPHFPHSSRTTSFSTCSSSPPPASNSFSLTSAAQVHASHVCPFNFSSRFVGVCFSRSWLKYTFRLCTFVDEYFCYILLLLCRFPKPEQMMKQSESSAVSQTQPA